MSKKNLIVGMTGASGAIFGVRVLEALRDTDVTTHLVVSKWAQQTLEHETVLKLHDLKGLADAYYAPGEMGARVSSGSFITDGMMIVPCSAKSLAANAVMAVEVTATEVAAFIVFSCAAVDAVASSL